MYWRKIIENWLIETKIEKSQWKLINLIKKWYKSPKFDLFNKNLINPIKYLRKFQKIDGLVESKLNNLIES